MPLNALPLSGRAKYPPSSWVGKGMAKARIQAAQGGFLLPDMPLPQRPVGGPIPPLQPARIWLGHTGVSINHPQKQRQVLAEKWETIIFSPPLWTLSVFPKASQHQKQQ